MLVASCLPAETLRWTLTNHAGDYTNELVRLQVAPRPPWNADQLVVTENGLEVPAQVEVRRGSRAAVKQADIWVCTTIASKASHDYTVAPAQPLVAMEETHAMLEGDSWRFDLAPGWQPRRAFASRSAEPPRERELKPDPALHDGRTLMFLQPCWTQSTNCGWFFAATDDTAMLGAVAMRAGKWDWPYDNQIIVEAAASGDTARLVYPTWKGRRFSYLLAGPRELATRAPSLMRRVAMQPLDKLVNEYTLDWLIQQRDSKPRPFP